MLGMLSTTPYSMLRADNFVDDHEQGVRTRRTAPHRDPQARLWSVRPQIGQNLIRADRNSRRL